MFSPDQRPSFISRVRSDLQKTNTLDTMTNMSYGIAALVADGASRAVALKTDILPAVSDFIISYGHDALFPVQCYFLLRATWLDANNRSRFSWLKNITGASAIFTIASGLELAQRAGWYEGTYDPGDFIAYGAGVGLAVTLDALTFRRLHSRSQ